MSPKEQVELLYRRVADGWNAMDADGIASAFAESALMVGYDGSEMRGRNEIASALRDVFDDHTPGRWVALVRDITFPTPNLALLRAHAGWFGARTPESLGTRRGSVPEWFPQAVQSMVALSTSGRWQIVLLQSTPAALHGRPQAAAALAEELRSVAAREV
jgi:uncharacterized protein (TIGR02246 family)